MPTVRVSWWHTETFERDIDMPEDFDPEADDADEQLEAAICELEQEELSEAFTGCTERVITEREVVE